MALVVQKEAHPWFCETDVAALEPPEDVLVLLHEAQIKNRTYERMFFDSSVETDLREFSRTCEENILVGRIIQEKLAVVQFEFRFIDIRSAVTHEHLFYIFSKGHAWTEQSAVNLVEAAVRQTSSTPQNFVLWYVTRRYEEIQTTSSRLLGSFIDGVMKVHNVDPIVCNVLLLDTTLPPGEMDWINFCRSRPDSHFHSRCFYVNPRSLSTPVFDMGVLVRQNTSKLSTAFGKISAYADLPRDHPVDALSFYYFKVGLQRLSGDGQLQTLSDRGLVSGGVVYIAPSDVSQDEVTLCVARHLCTQRHVCWRFIAPSLPESPVLMLPSTCIDWSIGRLRAVLAEYFGLPDGDHVRVSVVDVHSKPRALRPDTSTVGQFLTRTDFVSVSIDALVKRETPAVFVVEPLLSAEHLLDLSFVAMTIPLFNCRGQPIGVSYRPYSRHSKLSYEAEVADEAGMPGLRLFGYDAEDPYKRAIDSVVGRKRFVQGCSVVGYDLNTWFDAESAVDGGAAAVDVQQINMLSRVFLNIRLLRGWTDGTHDVVTTSLNALAAPAEGTSVKHLKRYLGALLKIDSTRLSLLVCNQRSIRRDTVFFLSEIRMGKDGVIADAILSGKSEPPFMTLLVSDGTAATKPFPIGTLPF